MIKELCLEMADYITEEIKNIDLDIIFFRGLFRESALGEVYERRRILAEILDLLLMEKESLGCSRKLYLNFGTKQKVSSEKSENTESQNIPVA